ncbi:WhiB family transcriptional regulator [Streptomyces leeuwenhoekii]|uniref:WhiB family transcriptional regulator n=1 Tax=Streptomyces leeuwenhoekii TaxID=1437453 RepID=UPI0037018C84
MTTLADLTATTPGLPCRTTPDLWFSTDPIERHDAAQQCRQCPLLLDCMRYALANDEQHGVWGGVDFEARGCGSDRGFRAHRTRGEQPCPMCQAAHDEAVEADRRRLLAVAHAAGGTVRGYWMHRRLGEEACVPCKRAQARKSAERRRAVRAAAERPVAVLGDRRAVEPAPGAPAGVQAA